MAFSRTWNAAYEADPADSDQASGGALDIRQTKIDTRERLEIDHSWAGDADDGMHLQVTFVDPLGAKPTQSNDETYLYTKDVSATSELFFEDESGNEVQLTNAGAITYAFPATTAMLFYQDAAPTGWTIAAVVDEHAVRLTKGSVAGGQAGGAVGGTNNFSTQFASLAEGATPGVGDHVITTAEMAAHTHGSAGAHTHTVGYSTAGVVATNIKGETIGADTTTKTSSSAGSHTHSSVGSGTAHGHTVDLRVKWAACIVATKD